MGWGGVSFVEGLGGGFVQGDTTLLMFRIEVHNGWMAGESFIGSGRKPGEFWNICFWRGSGASFRFALFMLPRCSLCLFELMRLFFQPPFISVRDESVDHRMPTRLMELVKQYPYSKGLLVSTAENKYEVVGEGEAKDKVEQGEKEELILPRPRFSTRTYDALFVRIDTELPHSPIDTPSSPVQPTNKSSSKISSKTGNKSTTTIATTATTATTNRQHQHPKRGHLRLLAEAFKADLITESNEDGDGSKYMNAWERIRNAALVESSSDSEAKKDDTKSKKVPVLNRVFADETVRLLSLIPSLDEDEDGLAVELVSGALVVGGRVGRSTVKGSSGSRRRSSSFSHILNYKESNGTPTTNGLSHSPTHQSRPPASVPLPPSPVIDWAQFTTAGFEAGKDSDDVTGKRLLLTGLLDPDDVEVTKSSIPASSSTVPTSFPSPFSVVARTVSRSRSGKRRRDASRRSSADSPNPSANQNLNGDGKEAAGTVKVGKSKATRVKHVQLDEAFVDFWSDAVLDPISASWPTFVVCKLNPGAGAVISGGDGGGGGMRTEINWLVVEQTYTSPPVPGVAPDGGAAASGKRASSPRPSLRSDLSRMGSTFSASTRKRFSFFASGGGGGGVVSGKIEKTKTKTGSGVGRKSSVKGVRIGEMGEILPEVVENPEVAEKLEEASAGTMAGHVVSDVNPTLLSTSDAGMTKAPRLDEDRIEDQEEAAPAKSEDSTAVAGILTAVVVGAATAVAAKDEVDTKGDTAERLVITEADATKETREEAGEAVVSAVSVEAEPVLPPAHEEIVLSATTPSPQVALYTSESAAKAAPVEPSSTPHATDVAEAIVSVSVEDALGPTAASYKEPAAIEPLEVDDEPASVWPVAEDIPVIPTSIAAEEAMPVPEPTPEPATRPAPLPIVDAPAVLAEGPAITEEAIEEVVEPTEEPISAPELEPEPVIDPTPPVETAVVVEEEVEPVVEIAEPEPQTVLQLDVEAVPPSPPVEAATAVVEEVELVLETAEGPLSAPEPEPEPVVDAEQPSPPAELAAVVDDIEPMVETAEDPISTLEPEPVLEPVLGAASLSPSADAAATVEEVVETVVETDEGSTSASELKPEFGLVPEPAVNATPSSPPAEATAVANKDGEEIAKLAEESEVVTEDFSAPAVAIEEVPELVREATPEPAVGSGPEFEPESSSEAVVPEPGTSAPVPEAVEESHPNSRPVSAVPEIALDEVQSPEADDITSEPEPTEPAATHNVSSHGAGEALAETTLEPESGHMTLAASQEDSPIQVATHALPDPEPVAPETPLGVSLQATAEVSESIAASAAEEAESAVVAAAEYEPSSGMSPPI